MRSERTPASERPLGVFDSGLGGLTVVRELQRLLPQESIVYLGDTARVPYGTRSAETVIKYARACARLLVERDIKALVVACNTVSAVALEMLRAELDLLVVGVVEPGAEAAVLMAEHGQGTPRIGVLGTQGTIASGAYERAVHAKSSRLEVIGQTAPLLVPLVEEGWLEGEVPKLVAARYLGPLVEAGATVVVLGCTHYPLLKDSIVEVLRELRGSDIPLVDSARATAEHVQRLLGEQGMLARGPSATLELLVTDLPKSFSEVAARFLGRELPEIRQVDLQS